MLIMTFGCDRAPPLMVLVRGSIPRTGSHPAPSYALSFTQKTEVTIKGRAAQRLAELLAHCRSGLDGVAVRAKSNHGTRQVLTALGVFVDVIHLKQVGAVPAACRRIARVRARRVLASAAAAFEDCTARCTDTTETCPRQCARLMASTSANRPFSLVVLAARRARWSISTRQAPPSWESNGSLDRGIAAGRGHEGRASW